MKFTYGAYREMLHSLRQHGYSICTYENWRAEKKSAILRHDIDNDIGKALQLAELERDEGVSSTYFVLVTSDFYNVFSAESGKLLRKIADCGHEIGLHFDEVRYPEIVTPEDARTHILEEAGLLGLAAGTTVKTVSMHRPSKMMLAADLSIPGLINSYGQEYFKGFKYVSDSRRRWREPVEEIIASGEYDRLHILTHAIWYSETDMDIHDCMCAFVNGGNRMRYQYERENITDLESIMREDEIK